MVRGLRIPSFGRTTEWHDANHSAPADLRGYVALMLDGEALPHGVDVDENGNGVLHDGRPYHLVREHDAIRERTLGITFHEPGVEACSYTFE